MFFIDFATVANNSTNLLPKQKLSLATLLNQFCNQFIEDGSIPPLASIGQHHIQLKKGARPVNQRPYKLAIAYHDYLEGEINKWLEAGIIIKSNSEWGSPVVIVPKKNGQLRMCVDYRALNAITANDTYPMPIVDEILSSFGGAKYFTNIDLFSGYYQLGLDEESQNYTSFNS